jgi:diguanylate cyclase (GGDEF)-like protein/PAS domain S-box-containing protein
MSFGDRLNQGWKFLRAARWPPQRVLLSALGVTGCIVAIRLAGLLQSWELATFDQLIRLRPLPAPDDRLVIVSIDEPDLREVGQFPIPDAAMTRLIQQIAQAKPRAIGLDIYRDIPVEPGHQSLRQLFKTTPNLVGIEHIGDLGGPNIPPPPVLPKPQIGFNNIVHDADDKVRRGLLYFSGHENQEARQSFALALALMYLSQEGISAETASDQTGFLQLGQTIFRRFTAYDGSYVHADEGGYQILLNPRGPANTFRRVAMTDVMRGKIPAQVFRDRIVLIGYTAISTNDFALMSYSSNLLGAPLPIPGVELHANIISQIISGAKGEKPMLTSWAEPVEWLWILVWAGLGAGISWKLRSFKLSLLALLTAILAIGVIGLWLLIQGVWIPVIPPFLALTGAAIVITAHIARSEEELRRSKEFLGTIINTIPDPIYVKDRLHRWIVLNEAFANLLRQPREALLERSGYDIFSVQEAASFHQYDEMVFTSGEAHQNEEVFTDADGVTHHTETKRSLHRDAAGNVFLVGIIRDITQRKRMEEELKRTAAELLRSNAELQKSASRLNHFANHDSLTGLPNRKLFYEQLQQAIQWAADRHQLIGVLFLDLDGFKEINDSKGHNVGDLVLKTVAARLSGCLRGSDTVSRLGGDEFTVILPAIPSAQDAARVAEKVLSTLSRPFVFEGDTVSVTTSIGISLYPNDAQDAEILVKAADGAMYQAKQHGKSCYKFASSHLVEGL